ncbi:ribonuclease III [Haloimpatiens sp. FM7330]|uniref:ribonuclease III n=1 Tax=Haloimpatiens sp. FM7330 TaxID=3298610 RepID=UPI00363F508A
MEYSRKNILMELEEKIGVKFENKNLLEIALTHSSYVNHKKNTKFNERLEFLGDAVLELTISEYLFKEYNKKDEGDLTKIRALIVCENSLYQIAKKWELGKYINMSKGEELTGGRTRVSILSDCVEAIIAAIYLDKGFECAKEFIVCTFDENIKKAVNNEIILDYKTKLQEDIQQRGEISIMYNLVKHEGPPHRRKFYVDVIVDDKILGNGNGYSKKEAEQNAAKKALKEIGGK